MNRCFVLWTVFAASWVRAADPPALEVWQTIIRAPEMEVLDLAANPTVTDAMLSRRLREAVREGRARMLADVRGSVDDLQSAEVSTGHRVWLPTELDQDLDRLYMTPTAYEEYLIGTSLTCRPEIMTAPDKASVRVSASWLTRCSPRGPLAVLWPTSWLRVYEDDKPTGKAIHGWLDWRDLFEESVSGQVSFVPGQPKLMAILPPAERVWPGEEGEKERQLDVVLAGIDPWTQGPPLIPPERTLLLGIALPNEEALKAMAARDPANDEALLESMMEKVRGGTARLILSAASGGGSSGTSVVLTSARMHSFPTEMPSIPSAWDERPVGTRWESDGSRLALHQDLAPPARTEWRLAQDVPEAIMWEPRFRGLEIDTVHSPLSGTYLLAALRVPEVMRGNGLPADETVLIFASHRSNLKASPPETRELPRDPFRPDDGVSVVSLDYFEAEMLVFEVPAKEEGMWQAAFAADSPGGDVERFRVLLERAKSGGVEVVAHQLLHVQSGNRMSSRITEDYMTAMEFDPPRSPGSPRMRPTGLETLPVGCRWEIELALVGPGAAAITLSHTFENSTAKPVEPLLAETLAIAARDSHDYPGATHHFETWRGTVTLALDQPLCLGTQDPPGDDRDVRHVAFLRVRKLPTPTP